MLRLAFLLLFALVIGSPLPAQESGGAPVYIEMELTGIR